MTSQSVHYLELKPEEAAQYTCTHSIYKCPALHVAQIRNLVTAKQVFIKYADLALNNISMIESSTYVYMHEQSVKHVVHLPK